MVIKFKVIPSTIGVNKFKLNLFCVKDFASLQLDLSQENRKFALIMHLIIAELIELFNKFNTTGNELFLRLVSVKKVFQLCFQYFVNGKLFFLTKLSKTNTVI